MKQKSIAVCAHPDDLEYFCGGSTAAMIRDGWDVQLIVATDGDKGTKDRRMSGAQLASERRRESMEAAEILGLSKVYFLGKEDGELRSDGSLRRDIARILRSAQPDRMITFDPWRKYELHPDHREIGFAALDARLAARLPLYYPEQLRDGLEDWTIREVLLFNTDNPDYFVDIGDTFDLKIQALGAHRSQWKSMWHDTLSDLQREAERMGATAGFKFAEGFKRIHIPAGPVSMKFESEKGD
ncbi:MAG: PIG-L family deacetylase [Firmicutes bacterium]|nr:PIG-L family deacetylase [Bacillota bacterium]MDD4336996.1 PIG-L family deacetylase [Bacillota bacterium]MDD4792598.1 PIG-L family deacetylase [Bacillota bacterium]